MSVTNRNTEWSVEGPDEEDFAIFLPEQAQ
jgi:hypothetical protein